LRLSDGIPSIDKESETALVRPERGEADPAANPYVQTLLRKLSEAANETHAALEERDQALEDLRNVEAAFSDVHRY